MEYSYRTASNIFDVDIQEELESFDTVMIVHPHHDLGMVYDEEYQNVDYILELKDLSEIEDIKEAINNLGWPSVYFEWEEEISEKESTIHMIRYPKKEIF